MNPVNMGCLTLTEMKIFTDNLIANEDVMKDFSAAINGNLFINLTKIYF